LAKHIDFYIAFLERGIACHLRVPAVAINPRGTSSTCPICGSKLVENSYRKLKCIKCGFEADRDATAILNIEKKAHEKIWGSLTTPTAPQMTDVIPNR
jgi:transposase